MSDTCNNELYEKVASKDFHPEHVAEVGVWHPETSNIYLFIQDGIKSSLFEPDPESISLIKDCFKDNNNVILHETAICDFNGDVKLYKRASSTFVSLLTSSPAIVNDTADLGNTDTFTAKAIMFNEIDDGGIDLISIDTEGSEWFVIKNMVSRPTVISIETHGGAYINPYIDELLSWMKNNGYVIWYKDKSDSVYVKKDTISPGLSEKINLFFMDIKIRLKALKKRLSIFRKKHLKTR